uniref:Uncharacterized protein n=1 Tax=Oryza sativa subsp. japonica TaxID=39947 RepID=Q6K304_ORYSJ|nr:hypothetical protein [Oryza sativa Japonica Group]
MDRWRLSAYLVDPLPTSLKRDGSAGGAAKRSGGEGADDAPAPWRVDLLWPLPRSGGEGASHTTVPVAGGSATTGPVAGSSSPRHGNWSGDGSCGRDDDNGFGSGDDDGSFDCSDGGSGFSCSDSSWNCDDGSGFGS